MKSVVKPKIAVGLFGMASAGLVKLNCRKPVSYRISAWRVLAAGFVSSFRGKNVFFQIYLERFFIIFWKQPLLIDQV